MESNEDPTNNALPLMGLCLRILETQEKISQHFDKIPKIIIDGSQELKVSVTSNLANIIIKPYEVLVVLIRQVEFLFE